MKTIISQLIIATIIAHTCTCTICAAAENSSTNTPQKSVSTSESTLQPRDPFWPVGFVPEIESKEEKQAEEKKMQLESLIKWPKLKISGITRTSDNKYIAIIENIGLVEPGDIISMQQNGLIYRWQINSINSRGLSRTRLDAKETTSNLQNSK